MPAADLTFVGVSEDGHHLLLADATGARYQVVIDAALRSAARHEHVHRPPAGADVPRPTMSPREVQALIRAGATADEVADLSGWPFEKIEKYQGPIVAEREFVASLATQVRLRSLTGSTLLSSRVAERLAQRGIDPATASWDAWRASGHPWTLQLSFPADGQLREARWSFDLQTRAVTPEDDESRWLSDENEHRPTPAPFVPLEPRPRTVDDVDGGIDHPEPAAAPVETEHAVEVVPEDSSADPDLAPERPRVAAQRHEHESDLDLELSMRARSTAQRRRGRTMARPAPDAPSQESRPGAGEPARGDTPSRPTTPPSGTAEPRRRTSRSTPGGTARARRPRAALTTNAGNAADATDTTDATAPVPVPAALPAQQPRRAPAPEVDHPAVETERPVGELPAAAPKTLEQIVDEAPVLTRREAPPGETPTHAPALPADVHPAPERERDEPGAAGTARPEEPTADASRSEGQEPPVAGHRPETADAGPEVVDDARDGDDVLESDDARGSGVVDQSTPAAGGTPDDDTEPGAAEEAGGASGPGESPRAARGGQRQQPKKQSAAKRKGRAAVPSWDDIMFGAKRE